MNHQVGNEATSDHTRDLLYNLEQKVILFLAS